MSSLLIVNAEIINEQQRWQGDLLVREGRIAALGPDLQHCAAERVVDAAGWLLLPGMIDDQVHFRDPGLTHKGDIASESRAAVAGGITSFLEMPNTVPPTLDLDKLEAKYQRAAAVSRANFGFYLGASHHNLEAIRRLPIGRACGIKVFMGASTGDMLVDDPAVLEAIFADAPILVATHCEHTPTIQAQEAAFHARYGDQVPMSAHPLIRSAKACWRSSSLAVELAKRHGTRLHVLHLTTADELALFAPGAVTEKQISAEACVHHLYFSAEDYADKGSLIKCNPAIKTAADRAALRAAVSDGRLDIIATDHAPHTLEEKQRPYFQAPAGLPLVQDALPSLFEWVHEGQLSLERLVEVTSHQVADCFQIQQRGYLREGYWADLTLIDPSARTLVERDKVLSRCGWSPFEGRTLQAQVMMTVVNGQIAYEQGTVQDQVRGQRLEFGATRLG